VTPLIFNKFFKSRKIIRNLYSKIEKIPYLNQSNLFFQSQTNFNFKLNNCCHFALLLRPVCHNLEVGGVLPRTPVQNTFANSFLTSGAPHINPTKSKPMNHSYSQMPRLTNENKM
jgi:hypothetical protein